MSGAPQFAMVFHQGILALGGLEAFQEEVCQEEDKLVDFGAGMSCD